MTFKHPLNGLNKLDKLDTLDKPRNSTDRCPPLHPRTCKRPPPGGSGIASPPSQPTGTSSTRFRTPKTARDSTFLKTFSGFLTDFGHTSNREMPPSSDLTRKQGFQQSSAFLLLLRLGAERAPKTRRDAVISARRRKRN